MKKIVVLSYTGKVGKSTICNNLLIPRLPNAVYAEVETINESGLNDAKTKVKIKGRDLDILQNTVINSECVVVDVGASNVESFLLALKQNVDSHMDFDCFIVPVEANRQNVQGMVEAMKTIKMLSSLGVEKERIITIFNKLQPDSTLDAEINAFIKFREDNDIFTLNKNAVITLTPAFAALEAVGKTYLEMVEDTTNYRQILRDTPLDQEEKRIGIVKMMRAQGGAKGIKDEFDCVFNALFGG